MKLQLWFHTLIYRLADVKRGDVIFNLELPLSLHSQNLHEQTFLFPNSEKVWVFWLSDSLVEYTSLLKHLMRARGSKEQQNVGSR